MPHLARAAPDRAGGAGRRLHRGQRPVLPQSGHGGGEGRAPTRASRSRAPPWSPPWRATAPTSASAWPGSATRWFTAPVNMPEGLYFPGFTAADANPDMGDSAIVETVGLGAFAMAASPAVVRFVGAGGLSGTPSASRRRWPRSRSGEHPHFRIPALDDRGHARRHRRAGKWWRPASRRSSTRASRGARRAPGRSAPAWSAPRSPASSRRSRPSPRARRRVSEPLDLLLRDCLAARRPRADIGCRDGRIVALSPPGPSARGRRAGGTRRSRWAGVGHPGARGCPYPPGQGAPVRTGARACEGTPRRGHPRDRRGQARLHGGRHPGPRPRRPRPGGAQRHHRDAEPRGGGPHRGAQGARGAAPARDEYAPALDLQLCAFAQEGILQAPGHGGAAGPGAARGRRPRRRLPVQRHGPSRPRGHDLPPRAGVRRGRGLPRRLLRRARAPPRAATSASRRCASAGRAGWRWAISPSWPRWRPPSRTR